MCLKTFDSEKIFSSVFSMHEPLILRMNCNMPYVRTHANISHYSGIITAESGSDNGDYVTAYSPLVTIYKYQFLHTKMFLNLCVLRECYNKGRGKAIPLQAWSGPEGSRNLRFPDYMTTAQYGGKVVSSTHSPPLPPGNAPGTHFC